MIRRTPPPRGKAPKFGSSYGRPEWLALVRQVRKRSGGMCEAQVRCGGNPSHGQPHHLSYADFAGWRRLIVPLDQLIDCCHDCHLWYEQEKAA